MPRVVDGLSSGLQFEPPDLIITPIAALTAWVWSPDVQLGLLYELSHVATRAQESLKGSGVEERCSIVEGSFFESVPNGADAYLLRHIIHDWTNEQSVQSRIAGK